MGLILLLALYRWICAAALFFLIFPTMLFFFGYLVYAVAQIIWELKK